MSGLILGETMSQYLLDPAECPNATDKAFLPSNGDRQNVVLRAGTCQTSAFVIQLRTVPLGVSGPDAWLASAALTAADP
ncbi:MAG: hypothetical protein EPN50_06770 [Chloroflexota bacterium]|nr:MAG: hypothetical protein EPN50_06770 [Chloroflexota bacterium]